MRNFYRPALSLPKLTADGDRIWIVKIMDNIKEHVPTGETILEGTTMLMDIHLKCDRHKSMIVIYDWENMTVTLSAVLFTIMKKFVTLMTVIIRFSIDQL